MREPVVATDGHSYELSAISDVFSVGSPNPSPNPNQGCNASSPLPSPLP